MNEGLIRVRDFAQACGCTPQNIYGHLKSYAAELEGHTHQGRGRQGVLLDDFAQDFLRSVMYPKELGDNALMDEINQLRAALVQASQENSRLAVKLAATESERDRALLDAGQYQKALTASQEAEEARAAELQQAHEDYQQAAEALEKMRDEAHMRLQEAQAAEERELEAKKRAEQAEAKNAALMGRGLLARILNKGVD